MRDNSQTVAYIFDNTVLKFPSLKFSSPHGYPTVKKGGLSVEPSKKDRKLFREKIGHWQEAYMEILNQRYIAILSNEELPASERLWKLQQANSGRQTQTGCLP